MCIIGERDTYRDVQMEIADYDTYVNEARASVSMYLKSGCQCICPLKLWHEPKNDATTHCHAYAHGFILKEFCSNCVSCCFNTTAKRNFLLLTPIGIFNKTCFMTVLHRCASHKVRQIVIQGFGSVFSRT